MEPQGPWGRLLGALGAHDPWALSPVVLLLGLFDGFFPNRSLLLKGSSGGQRGGPQERLIRLVGRVRRTLGRPGGYSDFRKIFKIREN